MIQPNSDLNDTNWSNLIMIKMTLIDTTWYWSKWHKLIQPGIDLYWKSDTNWDTNWDTTCKLIQLVKWDTNCSWSNLRHNL